MVTVRWEESDFTKKGTLEAMRMKKKRTKHSERESKNYLEKYGIKGF